MENSVVLGDSEPTQSEQQGRRPPPGRFVIFRTEDNIALESTDIMALSTSPEALPAGLVSRAYDMSQIDAGQDVQVVFRQAGDTGFSIVRAWFGPDFVLPRHSHNADCAYYVTAGHAIVGSQVLRAGDGFFVPAGHPYSYRAGPEGVEVLEFRHATSFDIDLGHESERRWTTIFEVAASHQEIWSQTRPGNTRAPRPKETIDD